ncbi:MAG: AAA family ATPase, partial [Bacteroidales bacterium]|nr:AAA family ATPase [Bacteroidales bacterium]
MPKKIPYGQSNFEKIMLGNYLYVDKTKYIEMLENESNDYNFLIRPRKFGKSLFLSTLWNYYDIAQKDKFEQLFGNLYIGKHPTGSQNSLFVLRFSFAGIDTTSEEKFAESFTASVKVDVISFITEHRNIILDFEQKKAEVYQKKTVKEYVKYAFDIAESFNKKCFVIIDEYDHFANDLIAIGTRLSNEQYKSAIWANSVVRDFYETLKDATQTVIDKIF